MKKCFWLSSYPKSGNTWLRLIIGGLFFSESGIIENFEVLKKIPKIDIRRNFEFIKEISFEDYKLIFSNKLFDEEMFLTYFKYCIEAQKTINLNRGNFGFFKTHNARVKINDRFYTDESTTLGFIYISRDPRDIIISYSKYLGLTHDDTINFMINGQLRNSKKIEGNFPEILLNWKDHYQSWKNFQKVPSLFIKYENLKENPEEEILKIINFFKKYFNIEIGNKDNKIKNIIQTTNFKKLKQIELKGSFPENKENNSIFFREGLIDQWKKVLSDDQIRIIISEFKSTMKELDYIQ